MKLDFGLLRRARQSALDLSPSPGPVAEVIRLALEAIQHTQRAAVEANLATPAEVYGLIPPPACPPHPPAFRGEARPPRQPAFMGETCLHPGPHDEAILAHVNGVEIEFFDSNGSEWVDCEHPDWNPSTQYRVKPEPYADLKRAYAAGAAIEFSDTNGSSGWERCPVPSWSPNLQYRIKPAPLETLKKAFDDGAEIEMLYANGKWECVPEPTWNPKHQYRITPSPHEACIQAHKAGATIEVYDKFDLKWKVTETPIWDLFRQYRIKPEPTDPHRALKEAYANGAVIELLRSDGVWFQVDAPAGSPTDNTALNQRPQTL